MIKSLLIIYPHWPPSNLTGVHRPRLVANNIKEFGYNPVILTVSPEYYEETPDWSLESTVNKDIEVIHVKAFNVTRPRLIGDIGLRAFFQLWRKSKSLLRDRSIDFIWIPIPSFYVSILGRLLHEQFKVPYGIDYIDPWLRDISSRRNLRNVVSNWFARYLEPFAVRKAALITGVAPGYFEPVLHRYFRHHPPKSLSFPYGFDQRDYNSIPEDIPLPWEKGKKAIVYAGAFLPNSQLFLSILFNIVSQMRSEGKWPEQFHFYFVGTGYYGNETVRKRAAEYDLDDVVTEIPARYPYLSILKFLSNAHAVLILGSTELHYTPSKVFQSIFSKRPILSVLHNQSSAVEILRRAKCENLLVTYNPGMDKKLEGDMKKALFLLISDDHDHAPKLAALDEYSAKHNAQCLAKSISEIIV